MNIVFKAVVTHLVALKTLKKKKKKKKKKESCFASRNPTKALSWTRQGFPLGLVQ